MEIQQAIELLQGAYSAVGDCLVIPEADTELKEYLLSALQHQCECKCGAEAKALTLDQLKQMDSKPVYIRLGDGDEFWALVTCEDDEFGLICEYYDHECPDEAFYGMCHNDPVGHFGLHVLGWIAYDREPKEESQ